MTRQKDTGRGVTQVTSDSKERRIPRVVEEGSRRTDVFPWGGSTRPRLRRADHTVPQR